MKKLNDSISTAPIKPHSRKLKVYYAFYHNRVGNNYPVIRIAGKYLRSFGVLRSRPQNGIFCQKDNFSRKTLVK